MADFARGQLLVELREARHLSQEDAAHEIGVTAKSLRAWEKGGKIRWPNAEKVGHYYGLDPETLIIHESAVHQNGDGPSALEAISPFERIENRLDALADQLGSIEAQLAAIRDAQEHPPKRGGGSGRSRASEK